MPDKVQHIPIGSSDDGIRLDRWFKRHFPGLSHGRIENMLRKGEIKLDRSRVEASTRIREGQILRLAPFALGDPPPKQAKIKLTRAQQKELLGLVIAYDEKLIVLNKPAGLAVQGGTKTHHHLDAMLDGLKLGGACPHLVHRLDKDTSGILLLGRSANAAAELSAAFRGQKIKKTYWALVHHVPDPKEGEVSEPIGGRRAETFYETLGHIGRRLAWVEFKPTTGRTHQIRLHAQSLGTPIVGDERYGLREADRAVMGAIGEKRGLHLHARAVILPDGREFVAPLPVDLAQAWKNLGFDNPN